MIDRDLAILLTAHAFTGTPVEYEPLNGLIPLNDPEYFEQEMAELDDED